MQVERNVNGHRRGVLAFGEGRAYPYICFLPGCEIPNLQLPIPSSTCPSLPECRRRQAGTASSGQCLGTGLDARLPFSALSADL